TRGEAGDNAIGPELFDALGLIPTEELLRADQYYGVDQQYFTTAIDYGFSKRLEEALIKWGRGIERVAGVTQRRPVEVGTRERHVRWHSQPIGRQASRVGSDSGSVDDKRDTSRVDSSVVGP